MPPLLRSVTKPAREEATRMALLKKRRKFHLYGLLRQHVYQLGKAQHYARRAALMSAAIAATKQRFHCSHCGEKTDMQDANACGNCSKHKIDACFGCKTALTPATRTWVVQCRDKGIYYRDQDYLRACLILGTGQWWSYTARFSGPVEHDGRRNEFEGPIPFRKYAFYAMARWQLPWREDARRRLMPLADCTRWAPTYCRVFGSREEMRRLPYCAECALSLERDHQGAPMMRWNSWQTGGYQQGYLGGKLDDSSTPITTAAQLHFI